MRNRSLDRQATRSAAFARRAGIVTVAAALVAVPLAAAAPANAAPGPFPITSVAFDNTALMYGGQSQATFNGDPALTSIDDVYICVYEYNNGVPTEYNSDTPSYGVDAPLERYEYLTSKKYEDGDVYTVAYGEPRGTVENDDLTCVVPPMDTPGLPQASLTLTATPSVPTTPAIVRTASAAPLTLKQGVPFDQIVSLTVDPGFDFTNGGFVSAGPQSSAGLENGELNPLEGIVFEYSQPTSGQPQLRVHGTPKYSGSLSTGFEIGDGVSYATGALVLNVADKNGLVGPISLDAAVGKPIAGSTATIIVEGLQIGAAWSATLRSTPIVIGTGTVNDGGRLAAVVTIPAGLEPGTHSITVLSTSAAGTPYSTVVYFTLSATGTLLAISTSAVELAATGTDVAPSLFVAGGLLLAGAAFTGVTVMRRRRTA